MSWDVVVFDFDGNPPEDAFALPEDYEFADLGPTDTVRSAITAHFSDTDWSEPGIGLVEGDGWSIEFLIGEDTHVGALMSWKVRGSGDPVTPIVELCKAEGWSPLDTSSGTFLDLDAPSMEGWAHFQEFRDMVIAKSGGIEYNPTDLPPGVNPYIKTGLDIGIIVVLGGLILAGVYVARKISRGRKNSEQ